MSVSTEFRKTVGGARAAITDPKPLHALAGAGDLLVARIRTLADSGRRSIRFDPAEVPARANSVMVTVKDAIAELPDRAQGLASETAFRANEAYDDLARRGTTLVRRVRRQQATQDLEDQVRNTTRSAKATRTSASKAATATTARAKATATTATKAVKATTTAAKATATTARKTAATTAARAKATTTSGQKSASAAVKATKKATAKVGTTKA
jgi:heparin binding hemagglutinin HbhA